jgi:hypothetical protein
VAAALVEGPFWAPHRIDLRAGRFPLGVEAHLMQMTAHLVPGITTVTINARYYALHGYIATVADEQGLDWAATSELLRRCEVVIAASTIAHPSSTSPYTAHGSDYIEPLLTAGEIDMRKISARGAYSQNESGFLNPYLGGELEMGILADSSLTPGARIARDALSEGFDGLLDLARRDHLTLDDVRDAGADLSIHRAATSADGRWLARIFCGVGLDDVHATDTTRRNTIRLLARALELAPSSSAEDSFYSAIGYGPLVRTDPILSEIDEVHPWRGTLLRRHSVNAWRELWAWLVDQIGLGLDAVDGHTAASELADAAAASCPTGTVRSYLTELPSPTDAAGDPVAAEDVIVGQGRSDFDQSLAILAIGGRRTESLDGAARVAFVGTQRTILDPIWVRNRLDEAVDQPLSDFVRDLTFDVLDRAQRIAARRARVAKDGTYVRPGRVHEHAGKLWKTSNEGRGSVGLRLTQLARNLSAVNVLESTNDSIRLTDFGRELLGP